MPLYDYECEAGHRDERFFHAPSSALEVLPCRMCELHAHRLLSMGAGACYFEEGRGRWIENLQHEPVYITSPEQHKALMKKNGVTWATKGRGMPGQWV